MTVDAAAVVRQAGRVPEVRIRTGDEDEGNTKAIHQADSGKPGQKGPASSSGSDGEEDRASGAATLPGTNAEATGERKVVYRGDPGAPRGYGISGWIPHPDNSQQEWNADSGLRPR